MLAERRHGLQCSRSADGKWRCVDAATQCFGKFATHFHQIHGAVARRVDATSETMRGE